MVNILCQPMNQHISSFKSCMHANSEFPATMFMTCSCFKRTEYKKQYNIGGKSIFVTEFVQNKHKNDNKRHGLCGRNCYD